MPRVRSISAVAVAMLPALALGPNPTAGPNVIGHAATRASVRTTISTHAWRVATQRHYGAPGNASGYSAVVTAGRRIWAFGGTNPGGQSSPVAEVWNGHSWGAPRMPAGLGNFLSDASATSPSDIWAVSGYGRYILHYDGKGWQVARRWRHGGVLSGVTALGPRDVWVCGTSVAGVRRIGTWHFNGQSWSAVTGIAADLFRASAVSPHDIWGIAAGRRSDAILHYGELGWRRIDTGRALVGVRWHDILAESATNVWLIGDAASHLGTGKLVLAHWNGTRWTRFNTAIDAWAGQLAAAGPGQVIGTATAAGLLAEGLIVDVTTQGRLTWSGIASSLGSGVGDAAYAPWSHTLWATGGILTKLGGDAAVWVRTLHRLDASAHPDTH